MTQITLYLFALPIASSSSLHFSTSEAVRLPTLPTTHVHVLEDNT